jgi:Domain of unknown function (DUF4326)
MQTRVIHVRDTPSNWQKDERYVYIGRPNPKYDVEGRWGNPIYLPPSVDEAERDRILDECDALLDHKLQDMQLRENVRRLHGRILVCFCKPKRCHGDHLALRADQLQTDHEAFLHRRSEAFSTQAHAKSLEEQERHYRMDTERAVHEKIQEAKVGFHIAEIEAAQEMVPGQTGMPGWFKRWKEEYWKPIIEIEKERDPQAYRTVNEKVRYNYYQEPRSFYGEEED